MQGMYGDLFDYITGVLLIERKYIPDENFPSYSTMIEFSRGPSFHKMLCVCVCVCVCVSDFYKQLQSIAATATHSHIKRIHRRGCQQCI